MGKVRSESGSARTGETFAERLRALREAAGLTQEELALRAGLSPSAVGVLERGLRKRPYPHTVRAPADALGLGEEGRASLLASIPKRAKGDAAAYSAEEAAALPSPPLLPDPGTPLVGRERELEEVVDLLARPDVRLLTLTGVGGVGKTRLAARTAREAAPRFPDGTFFVGLASLGDPTLVVPTVARALGLKETEGQTPLEGLQRHVRNKRLLLVLDNLEHLLDAAPGVAALAEECPSLTVLATSRAPLRVRGEREYPVSPLDLPSTTRAPSEVDIVGSASGRLFLERARAVSPGFEITGGNARAVAQICWRLAGIPLALELAAARVRVLDPATLLSRLDQALSGAWARDLPERQRTMRATLNWSYDLLSGPERALFRRLSVFVGGFSLEAAEALGAGPSGLENVLVEEVLDLLGRLVEQSLVTADAPPGGGDGTRYGMLEPVGQYAREKLMEGGEAAGVRRKHGELFLRLAERAAREVLGLREAEWLDRLETEVGNLRAALSRALDDGEAETAARFGWALLTFWWVRGYHREGRRFMEATLEYELPAVLRAKALHVAASMAYTQGDYPTADERYRESLRLSRREGDALAEAYARAGVGLVELARADYEAASLSMEEAAALFERGGVELLMVNSRLWLATALLARGEDRRAERTLGEALASARRLDNPSLICVALYSLAQSQLARGDLEGAAGTLGEGVGLSWQARDWPNLAHCLEALSAVAALRGEAERSAVLIGAAEGLFRDIGARVNNYFRMDPSLLERAANEARSALGDDAFEEARERGRSITPERAVAYAPS